MVIKLKELTSEDAYGSEFVRFVKKWKSQKTDTSLFVQFTDKTNSYDDRIGVATPSHSDPKGVYGYPLSYVIDHPGDIWYGQKAKYLRVLRNVSPKKTLQLQYVDYSFGKNLLYKAKVNYPSWEKVEKEFSGVSKEARTFFNLVQRKYNSSDSKDFTIRSATEQSDIFLKMGYWAIEDRPSRQSQSVINDREPLQICFFVPQAFKVEETYTLHHSQEKPHERSLVVDEPNKGFLRSIAQRIFLEVFNDKIAPLNKGEYYETGVSFQNTYFSVGGRSVKIDTISILDRTNTKFGGKPFKQFKKYNRWALSFLIYSEYGEDKYTVQASDSIASLIQEIKEDYKKQAPNENWKPRSLETYIGMQKDSYNKSMSNYAEREKQKRIKQFEGEFEGWQELAGVLNVSVPSYSNLSDDSKNSFVEEATWLQNIMRNKAYGVEGIVPLETALPQEVLESMLERESEDMFIKNYFYPILQASQPYLDSMGFNPYWILRKIKEA